MDPVVLGPCPCCGDRLTISQANLERLYAAIEAAYPGQEQASLNISLIPEADWAGTVSDQDIARAVTAAVTPG